MLEDERITLICDLCKRTKTVRRIDWEATKKEFKVYICGKPVIPRSPMRPTRAEKNRKCKGTLSEQPDVASLNP
jgi:hypothetical protein